MITDYTSLQSAIADYLGRSDLTTQIQTFINQGEARIYRNLRVAALEKAITATIAQAVGSMVVLSGGTGYTTAPTVAISAPPAGGTQATATATIANGQVAGVTITNGGSGYTNVPTVTFSGGGATSQAVGYAVMMASFPVPSDYMEMRELYLLDSGGQPYQQMERTTPFWIHQHFNQTNSAGSPYYFAREGSNFIFAPSQGYGAGASGIYWARLPSLSGTNTSNWLTSSNPDLILAAAMLEAATYLGDTAAVQYWEQRFESIAQDVTTADQRERMSGSPPVLRRG